MRRVVVTGLGIVTPLATGVEETWSRMLAGASGAGPITKFDASDLPCRIAFEVKRGDGSNGTFNLDQWLDGKEQRRNDDFIQYAMVAAQQAIKDSGYRNQDAGPAVSRRRAGRLRHRRPSQHRGNHHPHA